MPGGLVYYPGCEGLDSAKRAKETAPGGLISRQTIPWLQASVGLHKRAKENVYQVYRIKTKQVHQERFPLHVFSWLNLSILAARVCTAVH